MEPLAPASDSLHLPVLWDRLVAVADEAAMALVRTAFSTILRDANDYACMLLDRTGHAVAENSWAIPAFIGCLPHTMRHILRRFPKETWLPGDVVITNDPWIASGHLPDFTVVSPIFHRGGLFGFAGSVAHHADVGGVLWSAGTREIFEEGLRVPITRLYRGGEADATLVDVLTSNVRVPEQILGDLHAQIAADDVIARRVPELAEEEGISDLGQVAHAIQARAESAMRQGIEMIRGGTYRSTCELDGCEGPLTLCLTITVDGSDITLDYAGSSPQQPRALNVPLNNTFAHSAYALKCALDPHTPRNEGSYRPIRVQAPEGSLVNPRFPAPVNARHLTFLHFASVIFQALAPVIPERVTAESGAPFAQAIFSGTDDRGERFVYASFDSAGMGARPTKDGLSATPFPNNTGGAPVEVVEATTPLLFWEKALVADSGGAGRTRGGLGTQMVVETLSPQDIMLSVLADRIDHPARGMLGGQPGLCAAVLRNGTPINPKGISRLGPGDRLLVRNAGGGGYGPPEARARSDVQADLEHGYITPEGARSYGWR